jgi:hypothetical protein|tara:strand:+ start:483 stop:1022 length:540 start_codon:yes stop_codon:yes gene_type:complete
MAKPRFNTPLGRAKFPHLNTPDTAFDTVSPKFKVELLMSAEDAAPIIKEIKAHAEAIHGKATYKMPIVKDEETGEVSIKVQSQYQPTFIDSTGAVMDPDNLPKIGGGSELRAGGTLNIYEVSGTKGVALMLSTIQIGSISTSGADTSGFGALDGGGYVASPKEASEAQSKTPSAEVYDF